MNPLKTTQKSLEASPFLGIRKVRYPGTFAMYECDIYGEVRGTFATIVYDVSWRFARGWTLRPAHSRSDALIDWRQLRILGNAP